MLGALKAVQAALDARLITQTEFAAEREQIMQGKWQKWAEVPITLPNDSAPFASATSALCDAAGALVRVADALDRRTAEDVGGGAVGCKRPSPSPATLVRCNVRSPAV